MATIPAPVPSAEAQAAISPFGRVIGVLFSPGKTFEDIVRKPNWLLPVVISVIFGLCVSVAINQRVNWREYISQQMEKNPRAAQLSAEQKEQQISAGEKFAPISTYVFGTLAGPVVALLVALAMWGAYSLLGGISTNFSTAFSISAHSFLTGLISGPLLILILYLKPSGTADLDNPLATNLAVLLPDGAAKWLVAVCKNIDIIEIWTLLLLAIGFAAINPKKLKGSKSFSIALTVWVIYVACRMGAAFIFS